MIERHTVTEEQSYWKLFMPTVEDVRVNTNSRKMFSSLPINKEILLIVEAAKNTLSIPEAKTEDYKTTLTDP